MIETMQSYGFLLLSAINTPRETTSMCLVGVFYLLGFASISSKSFFSRLLYLW